MGIDEEVKYMASLMQDTAEEEILPWFRNVTSKVKTDFGDFKEIVTRADIESSKKILKNIRKKFPGSYSEEHLFEDRFKHDLIWQIDPVDGTQEFCEGMKDGYAMHAALLQRNDSGLFLPIQGIVYLPGMRKLWYTDNSGLHFLVNGKEQDIPKSKRDKVREYVRKVDPNEKVADFYSQLAKKLGLEHEVVACGGSGASISELLEGKINLIVMNYDYTKEWDLAMAEPMIKSRGGFLCDLDGNTFQYNRLDHFNRNGYVISTAFEKDEIIPRIPKDLLIKKLNG